jgi:hypothetical protein
VLSGQISTPQVICSDPSHRTHSRHCLLENDKGGKCRKATAIHFGILLEQTGRSIWLTIIMFDPVLNPRLGYLADEIIQRQKMFLKESHSFKCAVIMEVMHLYRRTPSCAEYKATKYGLTWNRWAPGAVSRLEDSEPSAFIICSSFIRRGLASKDSHRCTHATLFDDRAVLERLQNKTSQAGAPCAEAS